MRSAKTFFVIESQPTLCLILLHSLPQQVLLPKALLKLPGSNLLFNECSLTLTSVVKIILSGIQTSISKFYFISYLAMFYSYILFVSVLSIG